MTAAHVDAASWTLQTDAEGRRALSVGLSGGETALDIPSEWEGEPVTALASEAFAVCDGLLEVRIPASVGHIAPDAFRRCPSLARILVASGNPSYSDVDGVLFDASGTYLLTCPEGREGDYVVPEGTVQVDAEAFRGCAGLRSVTIPTSVQTIGAAAFADCPSLSLVSIPEDASFDMASLSLSDSCVIERYQPIVPATKEVQPEGFTYTVVFHSSTTSKKTKKQTLQFGMPQALRGNTFKRSGYLFLGWAKKPSGKLYKTNREEVVNLTSVPGAKVHLYALWAVRKYQVRFLPNGGKGTMRNQSFVYGKSKALRGNTFKRTGYTFAGWAKKRSGSVTYANTQVVKNLTKKGGVVTLYAVWKRNRYTVRFLANGGDGTMANQTFSWGSQKKLSRCTFTRPEYTFVGWAKSAKGQLAYLDAASVKNLTSKNGKTVKLYALWIKEGESFLDPNVILCLGDSITEGYACAGSPYPARLARMSGRKVINRGVGGTTSGDGLRTAEKNILDAMAATVCIQFGANDAIHHVDAGDTKENLRSIIRLCKKYGCRPLLATPTHQSGSHARFNDGVNSIVRAVRALAKEENVTLVDLNAAFGGSDRYLNPDDGLHLSDAGGDLMARKFYQAL